MRKRLEGKVGCQQLNLAPRTTSILSEDRPTPVALVCISSLGQNNDSFKVFHVSSLLKPKRRNSLEPIDNEEELRKHIKIKMVSSPAAAISAIPATHRPKHLHSVFFQWRTPCLISIATKLKVQVLSTSMLWCEVFHTSVGSLMVSKLDPKSGPTWNTTSNQESLLPSE
jgi:hypothetical protein